MGTSASTGAGHEAKVSIGTVLAAAKFKTQANASQMPMQSALSLRKMHQKEEESRQRKLHEKHPELKGVLDRYEEITEFLQQTCVTDFSYEQRREMYKMILEDLRGPYSDFKDREQRLLLGNYIAKIGLTSLMVDYYKASLGHYGLSAVTYYQDGTVWTSELGNMRSFFWDYSDASQQFAEKLARSGYLELMMRDLNAIQTGIQNNSLDESNQCTLKAIKTAISPVYNCSKLEIIKDIFRELNVVEKIKPYLKSTNTMIKAEAILIEGFIIDEQQNGLLTTDGTVFKFLIKGLKSALDAQNKRFSGFSTFELAEGLGALARNDKNKVAIVQHGALPLLTRMLASTDEEEVEQAAKTLWKLSFDQGNKVKVMEEANCFGMLQKLSRHSNEKIKKAALGALWTLKQNQTHAEEGMKATSTDSEIVSRVPQKNVKSGQHIMISYNWKDQKVLLKIKDALQQLGYNVWMDVEQMSGSTLQAMAEAVEKSIVVLICISEGYKNSDNCRLEAEYAFTLRKPIIPLMMQYKYTPDGWLGALRGSKLFFDFSRDYNFNVKLQGLVKELGERGKMTGSSCVDFSLVEQTINRRRNPANWSSENVIDWLKENDLYRLHQLHLLTGEEINFLKGLIHKAPEFFFTYLREELGIRRLRDLMKLNNALQKL